MNKRKYFIICSDDMTDTIEIEQTDTNVVYTALHQEQEKKEDQVEFQDTFGGMNGPGGILYKRLKIRNNIILNPIPDSGDQCLQ